MIKETVRSSIKDSTRLVYVRSTGRISSNHFSDVVLDRAGNAYIASFAKKGGAEDRVSITKISPEGTLEWDLGAEVSGRATAISIDKLDRIWVLGNFFGTLRFGDKVLLGTNDPSIFIAVFNTNGDCLNLLKGNPGGLAFDIHINKQQEVLIAGIGNGAFGLGAEPLNMERGFIAKFSSELSWEWTQALSAHVNRIKSDQKGNFLLAGSYYDSLSTGGLLFRTTANYDSDGFLMSLQPDGTLNWFRSIGHPGLVRKGYRTREAVQDIVCAADGQLYVTCVLEEDSPLNSTGAQPKYVNQLLELDEAGNILRRKGIIEYVSAKPGISTLSQTADKKIWISAVCKGPTLIGDQVYHFAESQSVLAICAEKDFSCTALIRPEHGSNMAFRAAFARARHIVFAGHFQSYLHIGQDSLSNSGEHGIFLLRNMR